jgi:hypothetical protein
MKIILGRASAPFPSRAAGRRLAYRIVICATLAATACASVPVEIAPGEVKNGVQHVRQLDFLQDVRFVSKTRDEAQQMMLAKLIRDNPDEELRVSGLAGAMTGLFSPGIDLKSEELKLMHEQVAGFYDPGEKIMVEVRGMGVLGSSFGGESAAAGDLLQAHELTHALQDQHFGLERLMDQVKNDDDEEIALHSVMEGDATLAGLAYVAGGLTDESAKSIVAHLSTLSDNLAPETDGTPLALSAPLTFQYSAGTRFVAEAWTRGGWRAVDALYHDPPRSSQQIIDPSLYFDHRTPPLPVSVGGYHAMLPDWKKAEDDTFGELLLKIILERNLPLNAPAVKLAQSWAGDQMVILKKDMRLTLIWMIAFHDPLAATAFADTYDSILTHRKGAPGEHAIEVRGTAVLVVIGPGALKFAMLAPQVWQASTLAPPSPPARAIKGGPAAPSTGIALDTRH